MTLQALPVYGYHPILTEVLDKACEHRVWFHDYVWEPPEVRREVASAYLSDAMANGKLWLVLDGAQTSGLVILNTVRAGLDAYCHFLFFDRELRNKRQLCLDLMDKVFGDEQLQLKALRVEVPEYAAKLCGFIRKALGFKYESERWLDSVASAKKASRKWKATRYEGKDQDVFLLSVTKEEFNDFVRRKHEASQCQHGPTAGSDTGAGEYAQGVPNEPASAAQPAPTSKRPTRAGNRHSQPTAREPDTNTAHI